MNVMPELLSKYASEILQFPKSFDAMPIAEAFFIKIFLKYSADGWFCACSKSGLIKKSKQGKSNCFLIRVVLFIEANYEIVDLNFLFVKKPVTRLFQLNHL